MPGLTRLAVLWDPTEWGRRQLVKETEAAAPKLGLQVQVFEARDGREIRGAFTAMAGRAHRSCSRYGSSMLAAERAAIADLTAKNPLPTMCPAVEWMDAGFVISYGTSLSAV